MSDRWERLPSMNAARHRHSSCTLGKTMYVLGGADINNQITNSIEKLSNISGPLPSALSRWQLIQPN